MRTAMSLQQILKKQRDCCCLTRVEPNLLLLTRFNFNFQAEGMKSRGEADQTRNQSGKTENNQMKIVFGRHSCQRWIWPRMHVSWITRGHWHKTIVTPESALVPPPRLMHSILNVLKCLNCLKWRATVLYVPELI